MDGTHPQISVSHWENITSLRITVERYPEMYRKSSRYVKYGCHLMLINIHGNWATLKVIPSCILTENWCMLNYFLESYMYQVETFRAYACRSFVSQCLINDFLNNALWEYAIIACHHSMSTERLPEHCIVRNSCYHNKLNFLLSSMSTDFLLQHCIVGMLPLYIIRDHIICHFCVA